MSKIILAILFLTLVGCATNITDRQETQRLRLQRDPCNIGSVWAYGKSCMGQIGEVRWYVN